MSIKRYIACLLALTLTCSMLAGCGAGGKESAADTAAETAGPVSDEGGKAIDTDYGSVTLMSGYTALKGEQAEVSITEEELEDEIQARLSEYTEYKDLDRKAKDGDVLFLAMKVVVDGEVSDDFTDEAYSMTLGDMEFGGDLDESLVGAKAGDKIKLKVQYEEDDEYAPYPGSKVSFTGTVERVTQAILPELTDDFAKANLDVESAEAFRQSVSDEIKKEYETDTLSSCRESLMEQVINGSQFGEYSDDVYQQVLADVTSSYESYADMFGMDLDDLLESFYGMTRDDLGGEAETTLHRYAVELAIAREQNLEVTNEEYQEGLKSLTEEYEYESSDELLAEYGEESIRFWLLEDKILGFLYDHAEIRMVENDGADMEEDLDVDMEEEPDGEAEAE